MVAAAAVLSSQDGVAAGVGDDVALADVARIIAASCTKVIQPPTSPQNLQVKNQLTATMWSVVNKVKITRAEDELALGQLLRDLPTEKYDWSQLDATTQLDHFKTKLATTYKLSAELTDAILGLADAGGLPVISSVLALPCGERAPEPSGSLSGEQSKMHDAWSNAAQKRCWREHARWTRSRDAYAKIIADKSSPTTIPEYDAFVKVQKDRGDLAECKGEYWLNYLIRAPQPPAEPRR
jgi:hypothetical protein